MGLTSAMYTGLTGMYVNQARIETIGNNVANVNTTAFKASRTLFQTQMSRLITAGTSPNENTGGVNPMQIGLGAAVGTTQKLFTPGSIETTGVSSDLALEGDGLFIIRRADGRRAYTRDGSFSLDAQNRLVTMDGDAVQGFGVDGGFGLVPNVLTDLVLPLGTTTIARATELVQLDGDLSANGTIGSRGSRTISQAFTDGGGGAAGAGTPLTSLQSASNPGVPLFLDGGTITINGATKGDREVTPATFTIGQDGTTLGDFATWLQTNLGIDVSAGVPGTPGVTIGPSGELIITSNTGEQNSISITGNDLVSSNPAAPLPFEFTETQTANGSSVYSAFSLYDSLGTPVTANITFVLEDLPPTGPVWRFYVQSADNGGGSPILGTGLVQFDTDGNFVSATGNQLQLDRSGSGAATPVNFTLDFSGIHGLSTVASNIVSPFQDGYPPGELTGFTVGPDGAVNGTFTNGLTRLLGQIAVAKFPNNEGLIAENDNTYLQGPNSGEPTITTPGLFGTGRVLSGALELSNVDLSREFIGLITSSTGFQAASRIISTTSDLLDQLLLVVR